MSAAIAMEWNAQSSIKESSVEIPTKLYALGVIFETINMFFFCIARDLNSAAVVLYLSLSRLNVLLWYIDLQNRLIEKAI